MRSPLAVFALVRRSPDVALAAAALGVITLLVAPLPPWLLDLCIAANLALSATIFMVALFARETLRLASFPSLLLFTTLLRLALEISSTRLVLARGDAGRIIQAFGQVVVAGNYVVGAVVFAILTLVQLLVVTRGAERVAEVAARFTLDALPGKQMSIDADLRAGAIDQAEARRRRRALEREGQLHGAMDGALKFVKGDAVAGVAIVVVNVVGGLVAGVMRGMPVELAARRYALLAIGDGLVAQIPALLVSVAAGVAVTRVEGDEHGGSLAEELGMQLFTDARVLAAVASLCVALALLPGIPVLPFLALALLCGTAAWLRVRRARAHGDPDAAPPAPAARPSGASRLVLEIAEDLSSSEASGRSLERDLVPAIERDVAAAIGFPIPSLSVRVAPLVPGAWRLLLDGVPTAAGRAPGTEAVALLAPVELEPIGIAAAPEIEPLTGAVVSRIALADAPRVRALGPVRDPLERVAAALTAAIRQDAHHLLGVQQVQDLLDALEATHPALVRETARQVPVPIAAEALRQLLEEGIALRPLHAIFEAMLDGGGGARAPAVLAEFCRRALRRQIAHRYAGDGALEALLLDPATEAALRGSLSGDVVALEPRAARTLLDDVERQLGTRRGSGAPVLLASAEVRRALRLLVATRFPRVAVLSYEELPPTLAVRPVGRIALGDS